MMERPREDGGVWGSYVARLEKAERDRADLLAALEDIRRVARDLGIDGDAFEEIARAAIGGTPMCDTCGHSWGWHQGADGPCEWCPGLVYESKRCKCPGFVVANKSGAGGRGES